MKTVKITNTTHTDRKAIQAKYCQSFLCQLRGLMFTPDLPEHHGLLLVQGSDSRVNSSIHMMFMRMNLAVFWINSQFEVVDRVLARKWKLIYVSSQPARYVLEAGTDCLDSFDIGDKVQFEESAQDG